MFSAPIGLYLAVWWRRWRARRRMAKLMKTYTQNLEWAGLAIGESLLPVFRRMAREVGELAQEFKELGAKWPSRLP